MSNRPAPPSKPPTTEHVPKPGAAPELTLNKVLAGAGAAATAAVLGSFFGAAGTIAGAALGSVASTIATVVYQRSLDRTQQSIAARWRPAPPPHEGGEGDAGRPDAAAEQADREDAAGPDGAGPDAAGDAVADDPAGDATRDGAPAAPVVPSPRPPADDERVVLRPPAPAHRRRWGGWLGATVLVFVVGLLAVTGIEWAKGSTLTTGQPGTSIGRVLEPSSGSETTSDPGSDSDSTSDRSSSRRAHATSESSPDPASPTTETAPTSSAETTPSSPTSAAAPSATAVSTGAVSRSR